MALLADLRAVSDRNGDTPTFLLRYKQLRAAHHRKPSLIQRLDRARLGP